VKGHRVVNCGKKQTLADKVRQNTVDEQLQDAMATNGDDGNTVALPQTDQQPTNQQQQQPQPGRQQIQQQQL
jgi:hypothetical protein